MHHSHSPHCLPASRQSCPKCASTTTKGQFRAKDRLVCYVPSGSRIWDSSLRDGVPDLLFRRDSEGHFYVALQDIVLVSCVFCGFAWVTPSLRQQA